VHGKAHVEIDQSAHLHLQVVHQAQQAVGGGGETHLVWPQTRSTKTRALVQRGHQGQSHAHLLGSTHQRQRHIQRIGMRLSAAPDRHRVVQVMKLAHLGVARAQQLGVKHRGDAFKLRRRDALGHGIHAVAPAPEIITGRAALPAPTFGQAGNGTLKGMAVGVDQAWQHRASQHGGVRVILGVGFGLNA
jgi:hypothetical protein